MSNSREEELINHLNFTALGEPDGGHHVWKGLFARGSLSDHGVFI